MWITRTSSASVMSGGVHMALQYYHAIYSLQDERRLNPTLENIIYLAYSSFIKHDNSNNGWTFHF